MTKFISKNQAPWLTAFLLLTLIFGSIYGISQQVVRQAADDPQIQIAEDVKTYLEQGVGPENFTTNKVDVRKSLAPFIIIYDKDGALVSGSGYIDEEVPVIPKDVLDSVGSSPYHTVTWEPKDGVRVAAVVTKTEENYVVSGRSLRVSEERTLNLIYLIAAGYAAALFILVTTYFMLNPIQRKPKAKPAEAKAGAKTQQKESSTSTSKASLTPTKTTKKSPAKKPASKTKKPKATT